MSGKSPICDEDFYEALAGSLEPSFPAYAVLESESPVVGFLLARRILAKGHESTVVCDRCEKGCEVPVEEEDGERFFVCPTGYIERRVPVSEDDVSVYRFDFRNFCQDFAKQNGLKRWPDDGDSSRALYRVARGRRAGKVVAAVYALMLVPREATTTLPAFKSSIRCDELIVIAPFTGALDKTITDTLANQGIRVVAIDDMFGRLTLDLDSGATVETPPPAGSYCRAITHEGREFLTKRQYEELAATKSNSDMFVDGFQRRVWKRTVDGKKSEQNLTPAELQLLTSYVEHAKVAKPTRFGFGIKVFETARRKADVKVGRYEWRAFVTHRTPADPEMKEYQFLPPAGLKYCVIIPLT